MDSLDFELPKYESSSHSEESLNSYVLVLILILILACLGLSIYLFVESNKEDKDENLKIAINVLNKESYENPTTTPDVNNERNERKCNRLKSILGDSNSKGLNDIYKNITGKESPMNKNSIMCNNISEEDFNRLKSDFLDVLSELTLKSIENEDKEKGNYDLVSLFIFLQKGLDIDNSVKLNKTLNSNGNIETLEIVSENGQPITPLLIVNNIKNAKERENEQRGSITLPPTDIQRKLNRTKEKAKTKVKEEDLNKFERDNNSKIKVNDLGTLLSHLVSVRGTLIN